MLDEAGNLVGTGIFGGAHGFGFIFKLVRPRITGDAWRYVSLHQFTGQADGGYPNTRLVVDGSGTLYGTAAVGGAFSGGFGTNGGVAYSLAPASAGGWNATVIHDFAGPNDASDSFLPFVQGSDGAYSGSYYGEGVSAGMDLTDGTIFSLKPPTSAGAAWTETILKGFAYCGAGKYPDGASPFGALTLAPGTTAGTVELSGQTGYGGTHNYGTVFKIIVQPALLSEHK